MHPTYAALVAVTLGGAALLGCGCRKAAEPTGRSTAHETHTEESTMTLTLTSRVFSPNETIPRRFTGDGSDFSPPLAWSVRSMPEGTRELALICDDPDAPRPQPWVHWVLYKIPADCACLPENIPNTETLEQPKGALQGRNSWGNPGYGGPAPPKGHGLHHYHFKLFALDTELDLRPGLTKDELLSAMKGHILATGELVGTYQR